MPPTATATKEPDTTEPAVAWHPDLPGITVTVEYITPDQAREWMELNVRNRKIKDRRVDALVRILREGMWWFDGEAFRFDTDGMLLDGQHRLTAIAKSGIGALAVIVRGLPREAQEVVDTGVSRTIRDKLEMNGTKYVQLTAAMARYLYMVALTRDRVPGSSSTTPADQELSAIIEAFSGELADAAFFAGSSRLAHKEIKNLIPSVAGIGLLVLSLATDKDTGRQFMERIVSGVGLEEGDARLAFRNRIIAADGSGPNTRKLSTKQQLSLLYIAWNNWQNKQPVSRIQSPRGYLTHRNFPEPAYFRPESLRERLPGWMLAAAKPAGEDEAA